MFYLMRAVCWHLITRRWRKLLAMLLLICACVIFVQVSMVLESYSSAEVTSSIDERDTFVFNRSGPFAETLKFCNFPAIVLNEKISTAVHLRQVHIFTRHGIRTPIHSIDSTPIKGYFNCSMSVLTDHYPQSAGMQQIADLYTNGLKSNLKDTEEIPGTCQPGILLPRGALQMYLLGRSLGKVYDSDHLQHFNINLKTTDHSRTLLSLQSFLIGLRETSIGFKEDSHSSTEMPSIEMYHSLVFCDRRYNQLKDCFCPKLRVYYADMLQFKEELKKRHAVAHSTVLKQIWDQFQESQAKKSLPGSGSDEIIAGMYTTWMSFTASDVVDELWPAICSSDKNSVDQPVKICFNVSTVQGNRPIGGSQCLPLNLLETVIRLHHSMEEELANHQSFKRYCKVAMYPFLAQLVQQIKKEVVDLPLDDKSDRKAFTIYSGHDHSLRILLTALEIYNGRWPPFASHIRWEWFQLQSNQSDPTSGMLGFRLLHDSDNLTPKLQFCQTNHNVYGVCSLEALDGFLKGDYWKLFPTNNINKECS